MTSIGDNAFQNCIGLTSVTIPNSVTSIDNSAFSGCNGLSSVNISCKNVGSWFKGMASIKAVVLGNGVMAIGNQAFNGCKGITTIEISQTITKIGERAFANIDKLKDVTCYAEDVPTTDRTAFETSYLEYVTLHVPFGSVSKYKATGPWSGFKEIVAIEGSQRTFVLTYMVDGEVYKTVEVKEGAAITPEEEPTKAGQTFSGWSDIPEVMPSDNVTVFGSFEVSSYTPGDVNSDGSVSVTDVGCAINYILEQVPSVFIFEAADMNGDKSVSVTDVGMIINLILSDGASIRQRTPERSSYDEGSLPGLFLQPTDEGYELRLEDKDAFTGFQFDVEPGNGASISGIRLNGSADSDHLMAYRHIGNGKWRVVCYSPTNSTFVQDHAALLAIITTGGITVSGIRLTTSGLNELRPADLSSMPTGIASMGQGMQVSVQGHTLHISSDCDTTLRLLTVGGNVYRILNVRQGVNSFDGLRAGIYMIENKKIIIR